jgi:VacB/RNase II family 3'-5' exoribonuclease
MNGPGSQRAHLRAIAVRAMRERGFEPEFSPDAQAQAAHATASPTRTSGQARDLRGRLWCSIDNDDSRDLDQLTVADLLPNGDVRLLVAVADVDAAVAIGSPCDRHAAFNTTSVYTPAAVFPMLPERFSTDLTSLNDHEERLALVIDIVVASDGAIRSSDVYEATVRNRAKLAYNSVAAWLDGTGPLPDAAAKVPGLDSQLQLQDGVAQRLNELRHQHGALEFETLEVRHVFDGDALTDVQPERPNRAKTLIANFMIAANGVTARFLDARGYPSLRRVVRSPERWGRIRGLAAGMDEVLPETPDAEALSIFLARRRAAEPDTFADLSTTVIRLLGSGEYVVDPPGAEPPGHFGLAVRDYSHSTAPNRRFPDLITQRLIKAALAHRRAPYSIAELEALAAHCTAQEDEANRLERQVRKSATAMLVESRVGQVFDGIVTGASAKGTYVRVKTPPMEGRVMRGERGLDVGDRVRVRLSGVDIERGFIDFYRVS